MWENVRSTKRTTMRGHFAVSEEKNKCSDDVGMSMLLIDRMDLWGKVGVGAIRHEATCGEKKLWDSSIMG